MNPLLRSLAIGAALACAVASAAAAAPPQPQAARACFYQRQLSSWAVSGDDKVNLKVGVHDYYQLKLLGSCPDLRWTETLGLETRGGSDFICSGLDVTVIVPRSETHTVPMRCAATSLRKLSPEEVTALPPKEKP